MSFLSQPSSSIRAKEAMWGSVSCLRTLWNMTGVGIDWGTFQLEGNFTHYFKASLTIVLINLFFFLIISKYLLIFVAGLVIGLLIVVKVFVVKYIKAMLVLLCYFELQLNLESF